MILRDKNYIKTHAKAVVGCDPADLGKYADITEELCLKNKFKGYAVNAEGKRLEKKNNWCHRQCKHQFQGEDLPQTVPVRCKCSGSNCSYQFKMKGVFKKWKTWGDQDEDGNYWVDKDGVPSKQLACGILDGKWGEWSEWSCQGNCPTDQFIKRTRKCVHKETSAELPLDQCIGESEEIDGKCLQIDSIPSYEPLTKTEYLADKSLFSGNEVYPCATGMNYGIWNADYLISSSSNNHQMYFNRQNFCHFPSFGKGWFDQVMENGDHVQMGVQCETEFNVPNGWNKPDHSIAEYGQMCQLVCKNLSDNDNVYLPLANNWTLRPNVIGYEDIWIPSDLRFQCQSPIPMFAFQSEKCNKNLMPNEDGTHDKYDDCYQDWMEQGLNLGSQSPHESDRTA